MPTYTSHILPRTLGEVSFTQFPDINVTARVITAKSILDMVRRGRCELGITLAPQDAADL